MEVSVEIKKLASLRNRATKKEIEVRGRTIGVGYVDGREGWLVVGLPYFLFVILSSLRGTLASNGEDRNSVCPGASNGGLVIS